MHECYPFDLMLLNELTQSCVNVVFQDEFIYIDSIYVKLVLKDSFSLAQCHVVVYIEDNLLVN